MKHLLTSLLTLGIGSVAVGQNCQADFTHTAVGQTVYFTDLSTASGNIVSWYWNFGDGGNSAQQNPAHTYAQPGFYAVCLFITDSFNCQSVFCDSFFVGNSVNCQALFTWTHVQSNTYQFHDQSTASGNIISWYWDFDDGTTSTQQNPVHTFPFAGTWSVCLTITTSDSCSDTYCHTLFLGSGCHAAITYTGWPGPTFQFYDQSTATGNIIAWFWDFGDGGTSTQQNPSHAYPNGGGYLVCLTIYTDDSCTNTDCDSIWVGGFGCFDSTLIDSSVVCPQVYQPVCGCDSVTYYNSCEAYYYHGITQWTQGVCGSSGCHAQFTYSLQGTLAAFIDQSTGNNIVYWYWDFGDGNWSTQQHPVHTYAHPGLYLVCLTIYTADSCTDTHCDSLWIGNNLPCYDPSVIDTTVHCPTIYDPVCGCDTVTYFNDCVAYYHHGITTWTYGPCGGTGTCQALFSYQSSGMTVHLTDLSTASGTTVGWVWDFGDGNGSISQNPVYTYTNPGTYMVCLSIITIDSCYSTWCDTLIVHPTGVEDADEVSDFSINPNPGRDHVMIDIDVDASGEVNIAVCDISGRMVGVIFNGVLPRGSNSISWNVSSLSEGVYFVRMITGNMELTKKVVVM